VDKNVDKPKKVYQSRLDYSKKYNSMASTIQISKELHNELKEFLKNDNLTIRQWVESLIKEKIK